MRIIIDTNIWISYLISKRMKALDAFFERTDYVLLFSQSLLDELIEVTQRTKFKKYFNQDDIYKVLKMLELKSELINVSSQISICRDEKDNYLLSLAVDGKADFLITGDDDLLIIRKINHTEIVSYKEFEIRLDLTL